MWNHVPTCTIRIPQEFKQEIIEYAQALDSFEQPNHATALVLIDAYINKKPADRRECNRNCETSPRWYHFNKFRNWVLGVRS